MYHNALFKRNADKAAAFVKPLQVRIGYAYALIFTHELTDGSMYSQQVGMILGQMLGLPVFNAVSSIAPAENGLLIGRSLDDCEELIEITLPAVLSAAAGIATPRIPSMKDILAGGKKPQIQLDGADIKVSAAVRCVRSTLAPESTERKQIVKEGDSPENIEELAAIIRREL